MSRTNEIQIEKSRQLIDSFKKNISDLRSKGVTESDLDKMSSDLDALAAANKECDVLREQLREKSRKSNNILSTVKDAFFEKKKMIKGFYPQEQWIKYGVIDKR